MLLEVIADTDFKVSLDKVQMVQPKVRYLGLELGTEGRILDSQCVESISKITALTDMSMSRSFLGLRGVWREFMEDFAIIATPLHSLLKKGVNWKWSQEQTQDFCKLKEAVMCVLALAYPKVGELFVLGASYNCTTHWSSTVSELQYR